MENLILKTYKFYDHKGRRLSVFAEPLTKDTLHVFVLTCSKKDQFSKKFAREVYEAYRVSPLHAANLDIVAHPKEQDIVITDGKLGYTLIKYCKKNFYRREPVTVNIVKQKLVKANVFSMKK